MNIDQIEKQLKELYETVARIENKIDALKPKVKNKTTNKNNDLIKEIIEYLNYKTKKNFKYQTRATQQLINARLKEGFVFDDFCKVIDIKTKEWLNDTSMNCYLRPTTLFSPKFEGYLNQSKTLTYQEIFGGKLNEQLEKGS